MAARLPEHLYQTHAVYKRGTHDVILWLCENSGEGRNQGCISSVRRLDYLADLAVANRVVVPSSILKTLRTTIEARVAVKDYFHRYWSDEKEENMKHLYFIDTLLRVYRRLFWLVERKPSRSRSNDSTLNDSTPNDSRPHDSKPNEKTLSAREVNSDSPSEDEEGPPEPCDSPDSVFHGWDSQEIFGDVKLSSSGATEEDEHLDELMAISLYVRELGRLVNVVQSSWQGVSDGSIPIIVASLVTEMCYQVSRELESQLEEYPVRDPKALFERHKYCLQKLGAGNSMSKSDAVNIEAQVEMEFNKLLTIREIWDALLNFKQKWKADIANQESMHFLCPEAKWTPPSHDDPRQFFQMPVTKGNSAEPIAEMQRKCLDLLLERMGEEIVSRSRGASRMVAKIPILSNISKFLNSNHQAVRTDGNFPAAEGGNISLSFGLLLLLESFKGQVSTGRKTSTTSWNVRVRSLQFANEVKSAMLQVDILEDPNGPCDCFVIDDQKVRAKVQLFAVILDRYVTTKNFDLYYQAPWISGVSMLQQLLAASTYGLNVWHKEYFVGRVLHMYNSLVVLGRLQSDQIPLLTKLSTIFVNSVFMGCTPHRNLLGCFHVWSGARLKFPTKKCAPAHIHRRPQSGPARKWRMEHVHDSSQGGNDSKKNYTPSKISLLSLISTVDSATHDDVLIRMYKPEKIGKATASDIRTARGRMTRTYIAEHVSRVQEALLKEVQGDMPVAILNYFKLYQICCKVLQKISDAEHRKQQRGEICCCVTDRLLSSADEYLNDSRVVKVFQEKDLVNNCVSAFVHVFKDRDLKDFTWQI